ncbi:DUF4158 domain-containing protein [Salmonella enterica]|nr:DUF4158 domain-containing protein [Salmonella enterica]
MPRRQILSSEEKERLLVVPDDDVLLTRMCFLSEHDLALINKHRRPANRLGFAVLGVSLDIENYCTLRLFFDLSTLAGLSRRNLPEAGIRLLFQI